MMWTLTKFIGYVDDMSSMLAPLLGAAQSMLKTIDYAQGSG